MCTNPPVSAYSPAQVEDTTHDGNNKDDSLEMLELGSAGAGAGAGAGANRDDEGSHTAAPHAPGSSPNSNEGNQRSPFQPARPSDAHERQMDSVEGTTHEDEIGGPSPMGGQGREGDTTWQVDEQDDQLPSTSVLTPLGIQLPDEMEGHESPTQDTRDSSVWGWGRAALSRLWGGKESSYMFVDPEVTEMVFGICSSSSSPTFDENINTNVTPSQTSTVGATVWDGEEEEEEEEKEPAVQLVSLDLHVPSALEAAGKSTIPQQPYNLAALGKEQVRDFLSKSQPQPQLPHPQSQTYQAHAQALADKTAAITARRSNSSGSTASTTNESMYSFDGGQESPHSRSKCRYVPMCVEGWLLPS